MDLRILLRDENPDLMNGHLTGEARAWYAKDRGRTTLEEILSLILSLIPSLIPSPIPGRDARGQSRQFVQTYNYFCLKELRVRLILV